MRHIHCRHLDNVEISQLIMYVCIKYAVSMPQPWHLGKVYFRAPLDRHFFNVKVSQCRFKVKHRYVVRRCHMFCCQVLFTTCMYACTYKVLSTSRQCPPKLTLADPATRGCYRPLVHLLTQTATRPPTATQHKNTTPHTYGCLRHDTAGGPKCKQRPNR